MDDRARKVLVVDSQEHVRLSVRDVLCTEGYSVSFAADATEAKDLIPKEIYDIIIMDSAMPGLDGMQALRQIREYCPQTGILMILEQGAAEGPVESMKLDSLDFIQKPFTAQRLRESVKKLTEQPPAGPGDPSAAEDRLFGMYKIIREIATGGTAIVWEAVQRPTGRKVALKVLHQHLALESNFLLRFEQEAKIAAALCHPNIVQVYDHGVADNRHFIAMEFIDGCSLESILTRKIKLPWHIIAVIASSVSEALAYSHDRNVLHRDVKPGNILLSGDGSVKVADFGFSRLLDGMSVRLTQTNKVVGTPLFMSPEMIMGKQSSFSSDIFSLGIVLYILACGRPPFTGKTMPAVMKEIMDCYFVKPRKVDRSIPKQLEGVIVHCLQKDTGARYSSMRAVIEDLQEFLDGHSADSIGKELSGLVHDCTK
jgi:serine/threonine protein kinase/CheY-like chemotaxis protein